MGGGGGFQLRRLLTCRDLVPTPLVSTWSFCCIPLSRAPPACGNLCKVEAEVAWCSLPSLPPNPHPSARTEDGPVRPTRWTIACLPDRPAFPPNPRPSARTEAPRAPHAVEVRVRVARHVGVDNDVDVLHVNAARRLRCGDTEIRKPRRRQLRRIKRFIMSMPRAVCRDAEIQTLCGDTK